MGTVRDLVGDSAGSILFVSPPDSALAEAAAFRPRPSVVSGMRTAEPAGTLIWWPEADALVPASLARLRWLLDSSRGDAWVVLDPAEGLPPVAEVAALLAEAGLMAGEQRALPGGETAISAGGKR